METQITKKQFIIVTVLVVVLTLVIVITVVNKNKSLNLDSSEIKTSINNTSVIKSTTVSKSSVEDISQKQDKKEEYEEEDITTTTKGNALENISKEIDDKGLFGSLFEPNKEEIDDYMDIDVSLFSEYLIKMNSSKFKSELYIIVKPESGNEEKVLSQIKNFLINYENSWSSLDYRQYDVVSNRKAVKRNGYLIYIVSSNNEEVMNIVRKYI